MERFWRSLAVTLGKRWKVVAVVLGAITVLLVGVGATRIEFATGQDSYLNRDSQTAIDNREFQSYFGGETVILLFSATAPDTDVSKLFEGENLATLQAITDDLNGIEEAQAVVTPLTSLTFSNELVIGPGANALLRAPTRDEAGSEARNADITVALARRDAIASDDRVIGNAQWNDLLIYGNDGYTVDDGGSLVAPADNDRAIRLSLASTFPNARTAVGGVVLRGNASLDEQSAGTQQVLDRLDDVTLDGFDLTVTGSPVYLKEINDYLKTGMARLGLAAIAVMAVVLSFIFKVRWRLLSLLAVLLGVTWTFSLLGLIGIDLSLVTIAGLPILIGLGIDFAIQVHNRIEEEVLLDHDAHPIGETLANLAPPMIVATLTGVVAFLALRISKVPMIRDFGVLLAVGIVILVITGIIVPASVLGIREYVDRSKGPREDNWIERLVVGLGSLPTKVAPILAVAGVGLFVGGVLVEEQTRIESDPIRWIAQDSDVVTDIERLEDETGFGTTLGVLVQANNVFDQQVIDLVREFTESAEAREEVVSSSSLVSTMSKILTVPDATVISPSEQDMYEAAEVMPPAISRALVHYDGAGTPDDPSDDIPTALQVNLRLAPASLDERAVLVESLREDLQARIDALQIGGGSILLQELPDGQDPVRAVPAGLATVGIGLLENLESNRAALTYLSLSLAGLYLVIRTRSLGRALLALVPVFLAIGVGALVVWALGITLSPLTTVSGPLVVASVAEFSVLIMGRHIEERQAGLEPRLAVDTAARRTGRAFFTSALTIIGGFAVLISSSLPLLRDFGVIVTLNVTIALLAALVLMPPMLVWADERGMLHVGDQRDVAGSVRLAANLPGGATPYAAVGALAFGGGIVATYASADTATGQSQQVAYVPASTSTTTSTTMPPTTTVPGATTVPIDPTSFPTDRPTSAIAGLLFDRITEQGVSPSAANCAIRTAYAVASEEELVAMGLAQQNPEAIAIITNGALACGITQEQVDAAIAAQFGG
jgi:uncharacterized protein